MAEEPLSMEEFTALLERVQNGDQEAAREYVLLCDDLIKPVIRRALWQHRRKIQSLFDSVDVFQDVMKSVFRRVLPQGPVWTAVAQWRAYMKGLARNKVRAALRHHLGTKCRNASRTQSLTSDSEHEGQVLASRTPDPAEGVTLEEAYDLLTNGLPQLHRDVLEMLAQGQSHEEIADQLGVSEKAIQRLVLKLSSEAECRARTRADFGRSPACPGSPGTTVI